MQIKPHGFNNLILLCGRRIEAKMRVRVNFDMSARLHIIHFPLGRVDVAWLIAPDFRGAVHSSPTTRRT